MKDDTFLNLLISTDAKLCVALIGGGGKTSLLHRLGTELVEQDKSRSVLLSSLTRMLRNIKDEAFTIEQVRELGIRNLMQKSNPLKVLGLQVTSEKVAGITNESLADLLPNFDACAFECDGARGLPFKAHNQRDPIIPEFASHAIIVVGADVSGTRISDGLVHRPDLFCEKWNTTPETVMDASFVAEVVTSQNGYHEKIPAAIPVSYFVNKADAFPEQAAQLGKAIAQQSGPAVWIGSIQECWLEQVR
jgi:probable selenium-dependent hydroxylase accessory protein YqeC